MKRLKKQKKRNSRALWNFHQLKMQHKFNKKDKQHKKTLQRLGLCLLSLAVVPYIIAMIALLFSVIHLLFSL